MIINNNLTKNDVKKVKKPIRFLSFILFLLFFITPIAAFLGPVCSGAAFLESFVLALIILAIFIIPIYVTYVVFKTGYPPKHVLWMSGKKMK